jgi:hypothetical protein
MRSSADLLCIEPGWTTAAVWPACKHLIARAIEKTGLGDFAELERDVLEGRHLLWLAWDGKTIEAAAATQLVENCGAKVCCIRACAGEEMGRWVHLIKRIEAYAKAEGCEKMRITGRKGWERSLDGYRAKWAILEKGLIDG